MREGKQLILYTILSMVRNCHFMVDGCKLYPIWWWLIKSYIRPNENNSLFFFSVEETQPYNCYMACLL